MQKNALSGLADVAGGHLSQELGSAFKAGATFSNGDGDAVDRLVNEVVHKIGHAAIGGVTGALLASNFPISNVYLKVITK